MRRHTLALIFALSTTATGCTVTSDDDSADGGNINEDDALIDARAKGLVECKRSTRKPEMSRLVGGAVRTGELPTANGGPIITAIEVPEVVIPGGDLHLHLTFSAPADHVLLQLAGDPGYIRLEVSGTEAELYVHLDSSLTKNFAANSSMFCNDGQLTVPDYLKNNPRYKEVVGLLDSAITLDAKVCDGNKLDVQGYIDADEIISLFPERAAQGLSLVAEAAGKYGASFAQDLSLQKAGAGDAKVALTFDRSVDLDLHVREPDGKEIAFDRRRSKHGFLDLDSNPACSLDGVNNENVYWVDPATGKYQVVLHYWQACTSKEVPFRISVERADSLETCSGIIGKSNEDEHWLITDFAL